MTGAGVAPDDWTFDTVMANCAKHHLLTQALQAPPPAPPRLPERCRLGRARAESRTAGGARAGVQACRGVRVPPPLPTPPPSLLLPLPVSLLYTHSLPP
jgi:hypothetical protein